MINYKIVQDASKLLEFIDFLPECEPNEQFYITLFARKKYLPGGFLTNDKSQLARKTATKDRILEKILQMESRVGTYTYKHQTIPQEALALYIMPNPRDLYKAGINLLREIADKIKNEDKFYNPKSLAMNCIQTTCSHKVFIDIDVDFKGNAFFRPTDEQEVIEGIHVHINPEATTFIRTNGGLHCLIEVGLIYPEFEKSWYRNIAAMNCSKYEVMMNGDGLIPCPGATQGGFIPEMLKL